MGINANPNTVKFWYFKKKPRKIATYVKTKSTGFYSLNGNSVIDFPKEQKAPNFKQFLKKIREKNPNKRIILILDNSKAHIAKIVEKEAKKLNIHLIFLPPYSPDLNPIEFIWKSIKRIVSEISPFHKDNLEKTVYESFHKFTKTLSFADNWMKKFLQPISKKLCA